MIYIYDIILNFNKELYEFFEWDNDISHIKRIPLFKVNSHLIKDIIENDVLLDKNFLDKIKNITEYYTLNKLKKIKYSTLICDTKIVLAIKLDETGLVIEKSRLIFDEEDEILSISNKLNFSNIIYKIINKKDNNFLLTKNEKKIKKYLIEELNICKINNNLDKLSYMYKEYSNCDCNNINEIYDKFIKSLEKDLDTNHIKIYNLFKTIKN